MKNVGVVIGILFGIAMIVIVVLPFFLGYTPGSHTDTASPGAGETSTRTKSDTGIFKSTNGGISWEEKNVSTGGDIAKMEILDFAVHPFSSALIFVGTKNGGLWRSEDTGETWKKIEDLNKVLLPTSSVYRLIFNRQNPQEVYAAVFQQNRGKLLKSEDRGESFHEVYQTPVEKFGVFDGFVDERGAIYVVTGQGGFFSSADGGVSWRIVRWFKDGITRLVVDQKNNSRLYALTAKGSIFKSEDKGEFWVDITTSLSKFDGAKSYQKMIIDPTDSTLYLASAYGLLSSSDGGLHWLATSLLIPPEALPILSVVRDPFDQNTLLVSASTQLYRSQDRGVHWSIIPSPTGRHMTDVIADPQNRGVYFSVLAK